MKKKFISVFLAMLIALTLFAPSVFAAEGYLQMVDMKQYAFSFPSNYPAPFGGRSGDRLVQFWINGSVAYCVEYGVTATAGSAYNGSYAYDGLNGEQKQLINYAMMYGFNGATHYGGTVDQEFTATQCLIWLIQTGFVDTEWEDAILVRWTGSGSVARSIYYQIKANVYSAAIIPSFTSGASSMAPTHEMTYNIVTGLYEVDLIDSRGVLSQFNFQSAGYTMTRGGNTLHITSANPSELVTVGSPKSMPSGNAGIIKYWFCAGRQTIATYEPGGAGDPVNAYFKLKLSMGNCQLIKTTEDGDNLTGISFTVTGTNGITRTATVDSSGKALVVGLPVGVYTVTENPDSHDPQYITAPPQTVIIQAGQTAQVSFHNIIKKGQISLLKFEPSEGDPLIKNPMAGVEFTITRNDTGQVACTITTDENGYAITPLLNYGVYTVTETYVEGHTILDPFEVFIDTDGKVYHYLIENEIYESMLKIVKTDAETGKTIPYAGAKFRIEDENGNPVVQTIFYPTPTQIDIFETAGDGSLTLPQPLSYGTYKLIEVEAPYSYLLNTEPLTFTITALNYTKTLEVKFKDAPAKGRFEIYTTGEMVSTIVTEETPYGTVYQPVYEELPLAGVVFNVIANEDIYTLDGTLRYSKDEIVDTVTTGGDGTAITKDLYLGNFRLEEVETVAGFVLDEQPRYVSLEYADQHTAIVIEDVLISNQRIKAAVEFYKDMELGTGRSDKPFANVVFGLYTRGDIVAADDTTIPAGSLMELITPNPDGVASVSTDLPVSQYFLKELATAEGYKLDETEYDFVFSLGEPEQSDAPDEEEDLHDDFERDITLPEYITMLATNGVEDGSVIVIIVNNGDDINNTIMRGSGKLKKVDTGGYPLAGAVFALYTEHGAFLGDYLTPVSGEVIVEGLSYGRYYWQERVSPSGFVHDNKPHYFEITEDGQTVEITIVNYKPDIPFTGDDADLTLWYVFGGMAVVGFAGSLIYLVREIKKNKKREEV